VSSHDFHASQYIKEKLAQISKNMPGFMPGFGTPGNKCRRFCNFVQCITIIFELCQRTHSLIFCPVGGQPFGLWSLFLLKDEEKLT
jgi:hypothetical protein